MHSSKYILFKVFSLSSVLKFSEYIAIKECILEFSKITSVATYCLQKNAHNGKFGAFGDSFGFGSSQRPVRIMNGE